MAAMAKSSIAPAVSPAKVPPKEGSDARKKASQEGSARTNVV